MTNGVYPSHTPKEDCLLAELYKKKLSYLQIARELEIAGFVRRTKASIATRCSYLDLSREESPETQDERFIAAMKAAFESGLETDGGQPRFGVFKDTRPFHGRVYGSAITRSMTGSQALSCANA